VITGKTIVEVSDASHTSPAMSSVTPTNSHAVTPMSLSQPGVANSPLSSRGSISTRSGSVVASAPAFLR
jgi:hypothetical protein